MTMNHIKLLIALVLLLSLWSCRKDCPDVPALDAPAYSPFLEPVQDTCYTIYCTGLGCNYVSAFRYFFSEAHFNPGNDQLIHALFGDTASGDPRTRIISLNLQTLDTFSTLITFINPPVYAPDNWMYYLGGDWKMWKARTDGSQQQRLPVQRDWGMYYAIRNDGQMLLQTKGGPYDLLFIDTDGQEIRRVNPSGFVPGNTHYNAISPDFSHLLLHSLDSSMNYVVDLATEKIVYRFASSDMSRMSFSPDNSKIVASGHNGRLNIRHWKEERVEWLQHKLCLNRKYGHPRFSNDGRRVIVSYSSDIALLSPTTMLTGTYTSIFNLDDGTELRLKPVYP